jgi:hypothetical protein
MTLYEAAQVSREMRMWRAVNKLKRLNLGEHFCLSPSEIFALFEPDGAGLVVVDDWAIIMYSFSTLLAS